MWFQLLAAAIASGGRNGLFVSFVAQCLTV